MSSTNIFYASPNRGDRIAVHKVEFFCRPCRGCLIFARSYPMADAMGHNPSPLRGRGNGLPALVGGYGLGKNLLRWDGPEERIVAALQATKRGSFRWPLTSKLRPGRAG